MKLALITLILVFGLVSCQGPSITYRGVVRDHSKSFQDFENIIAVDRNITTFNVSVDKKPMYVPGVDRTLTTFGSGLFDDWYRDVPGVNIRIPFEVVLRPTAPNSTIFQISNTSFFPINNVGFGTESIDSTRNFLFAYEIVAEFFYRGGEEFLFSGDDDVWVYTNDFRVIDIGGVHAREDQGVSVDQVASAAGMTNGSRYSFLFLGAERHTVQSNFVITTTILPVNSPPLAFDKFITVFEGTPFPDSVVAIDPDRNVLNYTLVTQPQNGTVVFNSTTGEFVYTSFVGNKSITDSFIWFADDGEDRSNNATVFITIILNNLPPIAQDATYDIVVNQKLGAAVNATDPDGFFVQYFLVSRPEGGTLDFNNFTGVFTFEAPEAGTYSFLYGADDILLKSNNATITINVSPPVATGLSPGAIAGIVVGSVAAVVALLVALYFLVLAPAIAKSNAELEEAFRTGAINDNPLFTQSFAKENPLYSGASDLP